MTLSKGPAFLSVLFLQQLSNKGVIVFQNLFALLAVDLDITSFFSSYLLCFLLVSSFSFRGFVNPTLAAPTISILVSEAEMSVKNSEENEAVLQMGSGSGSSHLFHSVTIYFLSFKTRVVIFLFRSSFLKVGEPRP